MRAFAKSTLREFWEGGHADAEAPLTEWYDKTAKACWSCFADVRTTFGSADQVGDKVIFNIGGNNYRLIVKINYKFAGVLIRWVGTHAEYNCLTLDKVRKL